MKDGMIQKTAKVGALTATEDELKKINAYTLEPLKEEDVYLFKIAVVSNAPEIDRDYEPLTQKAVESLAAQLKGKTIIFDHNPSAQNQKARIYDTVCEQNGEKTALGEPLTTLVAHCYMVNAGNADLIAEIKAGIKKEVSVGFATSEMLCSVCGKAFQQCPHRKGQKYNGKTCRALIADCTDAYEVSFVAVPCQTNAGTRKQHKEQPDDSAATAELNARIRIKEMKFREE